MHRVEVEEEADLSLEFETLIGHFVVEACMVRTFEQPRAQRSMNAHGGGDDSFRHVIVKHQEFTSVPSVPSVVASVNKQTSVPV